MRTQQKMMDLILSFARNDERVRIVGMEGSRTNVNVPKDDFQDYDISFIVTDMDSFKRNDQWLDYFGERLIMQKPEAMTLFPPERGGWFSYLMLFTDGTRIDLTLVPENELNAYLKSDKLIQILMDKDGRIPNQPVPTDADYRVKKPSAAEFDDCCNEFWWVSTYVAKGLCRREFLFAAEHLSRHVRPNLLLMMSWKVGLETEFSLSVGKSCRYLDKYVSADTWERLKSTFDNSSDEAVWNALFEMHILFRETALFVGPQLHYEYPDYDEKVSAYIKNLYEKHRP